MRSGRANAKVLHQMIQKETKRNSALLITKLGIRRSNQRNSEFQPQTPMRWPGRLEQILSFPSLPHSSYMRLIVIRILTGTLCPGTMFSIHRNLEKPTTKRCLPSYLQVKRAVFAAHIMAGVQAYSSGKKTATTRNNPIVRFYCSFKHRDLQSEASHSSYTVQTTPAEGRRNL